MLNAQQVIDTIHGSYQTGSKNGHRNVLALLAHMGVEMKTPYVHVAGTNGKGSTCAMLSSVLKAAGYKVGLYTSPFLQQYQERIRLNGVPLTDEQMVKYGNPLVEAAGKMADQGDFVTPFEMGTALAFAAFDGEECDMAIIEVGMGGRLDPTNVIHPVACAITAIGLDHMGFLGNTLEEIAGEKAGIITAASGDMYGSTVSYQLGETWQDVRINLPGQYQQRNAMTVLALVEELRKQGYAISDAAVRKGLADTVWPARLEWAGNVLIDGAHNPQGVDALVQYVDAYLADKRRVLLSGVLADKLQSEMLGQMVHISTDIVTVTPDTPRAMAAADYAAHLNEQGGHAAPAESLAEGLRMALDLAGADGVVIAAGSLYFAGALRTELGLAWR